ncbi:MAG: class I SAM-dependent methyltransferase [Polyangiales bacterium]
MNLLLDVLVPQLARPTGPLGGLVASALDRGNRSINMHVVGALDLAPNERALEIGFGGGVGLSIALAHEPTVKLAGIDPSPDMVTRCQRRFPSVDLRQGFVEELPWSDHSFDAIHGSNVTYFWPDLPAALGELKRVLAPGGRLAFGIRPPETLLRLKFDQAGHRVWKLEQYVEALQRAGFTNAHARRVPDDNGGAHVLSATS